MTAQTKILAFKNPKLHKQLKALTKSVFLVESPKKLVRALIEKDIDLIVYEKGDLSKEKIDKIFSTYQIPFFEVSRDTHLENEVPEFLEANKGLHLVRENRSLKSLLESISHFENKVTSVSKEIFISEVKNFFIKTLKSKNSFWIDIPQSQHHLPPILRCSQQLAKQRIDLSHLVTELDECIHEVISHDAFQVWKQKNGQYVALIWLESSHKYSQCLMLHGVQYPYLKDLEQLFLHLMPILNRRWNICCSVASVQEEVYKDSLTDLYNQKFLNEVLERKIEEHRRYKTPFSILFIDVDFFKTVNDSQGHVIGSQVLVELGSLISESIRGSDYAFRYGGDEFIILLGHTEGDNAHLVAERVRQKVEARTFNVKDQSVNITVSIGLASYPKHAKSAQEIIQIADEAMYYGKNQSRNVVYRAS